MAGDLQQGQAMSGSVADRARGAVLRCGAGTRLRTPAGDRPVEALRPGDRLCDAGGGVVQLCNVARRVLSPRVLALRPGLRPLCIRRGSLGDGVPRRDLCLAPQHRVLLCGPVLEALLGEEAVLAPVRQLTDGLAVAPVRGGVLSVELRCDRPALLVAEGLPVEGLAPPAPGVSDAWPGLTASCGATSAGGRTASPMEGAPLDGTARALMAYLARAA